MGSGRTVREGLARKFEYIRAERVFFAAAFRADGTNSLKEHDTEAIIAVLYRSYPAQTGSPPEGETAFLLELYCRGSVSMTVKWVLAACAPSLRSWRALWSTPSRAAGSPVQAAWIAVMLQFLIKLLFLLTCTLQMIILSVYKEKRRMRLSLITDEVIPFGEIHYWKRENRYEKRCLQCY